MLPSVCGVASINERHRKDGVSVFRVMWRTDGRQQSESFSARGTSQRERDAARRVAEQFQAAVERIGPAAALRQRDAREGRSTMGDDSVPLLKDWFVEHLETATALTAGTRDEYRRLAERTWMPAFGEFPLDAITREDVARWVTKMRSTRTQGGSKPGVLLSSKSMRNAHGLLSTVLGSAVRAGKIPSNVAHGIPIPRTVKEEHVFLTGPEFAAFLPHVEEYYQPLVAFLAGTGLRWGEATCLRWTEVDLDAVDPCVRVVRAWKHGEGGVREEGTPKTTKSRRTVFLPEQLADLLRQMRRRDRADGIPATGLVFRTPKVTRPDGRTHGGTTVLHQNFYVRVWQPAVRSYAGDIIEEFRAPSGRLQRRVAEKGPGKHPRVHDLRHTYASMGIASGVKLPALQRSLGHESIVTTVDTYGHLDPAEGREIARAATGFLAFAMPRIHDAAAVPGPSVSHELVGA